MMIRRLVLVLLGCGGCAEQDREPAALGELCGATAPRRVVALDPGQIVWQGLRRLADRYVYTTYSRADAPGGSDEYTVWSTGLCDESPRRLADGVDGTLVLEIWPDELLGCNEYTGEIVRIDPEGLASPQVVFTDVGCYPRASAYGLVTFGADERGPLVLHPYPDDAESGPAEPRVLLDALPGPDSTSVGHRRNLVLRDAVFVLDVDGSLLRVDLADGGVTLEQTGVHRFTLTGDGRYLLWQDHQRTGGDDERPEGAVFLRDRTTGEGTSLTQTWLGYTGQPFALVARGYVLLGLPTGESRLYSLPGLDFVALPAGLGLRGALADGRWLMSRGPGGPYLVAALADIASGTPLAVRGQLIDVDPDGIFVQAVPPCCEQDFQFDEGPLWFAPFDGSPPRRVSDDVSRAFARVDARRMIASVDVGEDSLTELVLVDLETREEQRIDRDVVLTSFTAARRIDAATFAYEVRDGERSGLWAVRLPAAP